MPMPSTMPAIMVRISASSSSSWASPTTTAVKLIAAPVRVMTPMTMPAQAQASAIAIEFFAPSSSASHTVRQLMPSRVDLRSIATGMQERVPASAQ